VVTGDEPFLLATGASYDSVAPTYLALFGAELDGKPLDRALLAAFAEMIVDRLGGGPVLDVGCGPGHITSHLVGLGLDATGLDLSSEMVTLARRRYPSIEFRQGSMTAMEIPDQSLTGLVAFYSVIHVPDSHLPVVFSEFRRVLRPGGLLLVSFQVGDEERHLSEWHGHRVDMHAYLRQPETIARSLEDAGLSVVLRVVREPEPAEAMDRCYLMARNDRRR